MARTWPRWLTWARDPELYDRIVLLARAPLFTGLPRRRLGRLAVRCFEKAYAAGEVVFYGGEPARALFVVRDGAVAITQSTPDGEQLVRTLGSGASFGELALIDDFPRSATARVTTPSRLLILYKSDFDALVDGDEAIALVVLRNLVRALAVYVRRPTAPLAEPVADGAAPRPVPSPPRAS